MKLRYLGIITFAAGLGMSTVSCVDTIQFGNAFLGKAPGGTVTKDTVFNNPEYARQFVTSIYRLQYYGLPFYNGNSFPYPRDPYVGQYESLTDCWQTHFSDAAMNAYYKGTLNSGYGRRGSLFEYDCSNVWEAVHACWLFLENVEKVPDMDESEKARLTAEVKCLMASRYFDMFKHYGGLPIVDKVYSGTDASYEAPRATVEQTVDFMVNLLDEAINSNALSWKFENGDLDVNNAFGRWTKAGAMALKCKILQFAASPLFNSDKPYSTATNATAEQQLAWWYGNYKKERWERCLKACEEFFTALKNNGNYSLVQANGTDNGSYRLAFRTAYFNLDSPEILHSVRVMGGGDAFKSGYYAWHQYAPSAPGVTSTGNGRMISPTWEYVKMFPWSDGKPFDYSKLTTNAEKDKMFFTGKFDGKSKYTPTRDPRLYESVLVNGLPTSLSWSTGEMTGKTLELWVGGTDASQNPISQNAGYATGFGNNKYVLLQDALRKPTQWVTLRLSDLYLTYAEALLQAKGDFTGALKNVDIVRARVGLKGLAECNPSLNLTSNKENLLNEILRERACELGMEDNRWVDLQRYKRADILSKQLHGLRMYRLKDGKRYDKPWRNGDKTSPQPTEFEYEVFEISNQARVFWSGFDSKWYLEPFPNGEVLKGYGLVQNPGW